jgi:hypothetical protein
VVGKAEQQSKEDKVRDYKCVSARATLPYVQRVVLDLETQSNNREWLVFLFELMFISWPHNPLDPFDEM